ncbi:MAG: hypothetical protein ACTH1D_10810 [Mycobacteriaceae bacterium]
MTRIRLRPEATTAKVMATLHETFEARDYYWEQTDTKRAIASEGSAPVHGSALPTSHRLRVGITFKPGKRRLVLSQETTGAVLTGAAVSAGAGPWLLIQLSARYSRIVKAVRADLASAGLI